MPRPEKVATVEEIRTKLESSSAAVLTEYRGLRVAELADLRAQLRAAGAEYKVFKNTLARRAAEEAGFSDLVSMLEGPTAITFVRGDAVAVAKALRDYSKTNATLVVKGGMLGSRVIRPDDITALADIAPREVLLARLAGGFQAPLVKAAGLFQAFTRNMAYGLKALVDQRVAGGEALPVVEAPAEAAAPAEETPAEEAPAPGTPADDTVAVAAPVEEGAPAAEAPADEPATAEVAEIEAPEPAVAEETAEAASAHEELAEVVPAGEAPAGEAPAPEEPAEDASAEEAPAAEVASVPETAPAESSADEAPAEDAAAEAGAVEETAVEEAAVEEAPTAAEVDGPAAEATEPSEN